VARGPFLIGKDMEKIPVLPLLFFGKEGYQHGWKSHHDSGNCNPAENFKTVGAAVEATAEVREVGLYIAQ